MSYDVYLRAPACPACGRCGDEPSLPDPTYNLTEIFDLALTRESLPDPGTSEIEVVLFRKETSRPRGLRVLDGRKARETTEQLRTALADLQDTNKREAFLALEPANKWGDLAGATSVIGRLLEAAIEYPDHTWEIH